MPLLLDSLWGIAVGSLGQVELIHAFMASAQAGVVWQLII